MLSHVHVGVSDFPRAMAFYTTLMSELGYELKFYERDRHWAGWMQPGRPRPLFLIGRAYDGEPVSPGNGHMVALLASDRATVDRCHAAAIAAGVIDEGEPSLEHTFAIRTATSSASAATSRKADHRAVSACQAAMKARAAASGSSAAMMALTTATPVAPSSTSIGTSAALTPPIARTGLPLSRRSLAKPPRPSGVEASGLVFWGWMGPIPR